MLKGVVLNEAGDTVVNIVAWSDTDIVPEGMNIILVPFETNVSKGWTYSSNTFIDPTPVAPTDPADVASATAAQARLALLDASLLDQVESTVNGSTDRALKIWYDFASVWYRDNPYVLALATQLGLSNTQIDQLFTAASEKQ